jgi:hypothetical protein
MGSMQPRFELDTSTISGSIQVFSFFEQLADDENKEWLNSEGRRKE